MAWGWRQRDRVIPAVQDGGVTAPTPGPHLVRLSLSAGGLLRLLDQLEALGILDPRLPDLAGMVSEEVLHELLDDVRAARRSLLELLELGPEDVPLGPSSGAGKEPQPVDQAPELAGGQSVPVRPGDRWPPA